MLRSITYAAAIKEATIQLMERDKSVYLMGEGVDDFRGLWGTTDGLVNLFGQNRVVDIPLSENGMTGIALGTAAMGFRPIFTHQRIDFMLMGMDSLCNHAAKYHQMTGMTKQAPVTIRAIIGKGWGQSFQHAQSYYPVFAHFPGIKIVAPVTPYEAKGLLIASVLDDGPVIVLEARGLYGDVGIVPEEYYHLEIGTADIVKKGCDLTIVGISYMTKEIMDSVAALESEGISVEVINLRSLKPLDLTTIRKSVSKTQNLVIVDISWECCSLARDIASQISDSHFKQMRRAPLCLVLPDEYVGASLLHEAHYYIDKHKLQRYVLNWWREGSNVSRVEVHNE